ncbi:hypothetical protein [Agromyces archimandritae]|uniref:Uncharacterized protein n=1 Tax=Agromyces archimandritae TaxID=2781962 RepID=A0A975FL36_9MICO|nr:hypothetical protein [Agromyces archimandritae]QTX03897.1 hypothetical protein G127AT_11335 [Agromyces archimandritae]
MPGRTSLTEQDISPRRADAARPAVVVGAIACVVLAAITLVSHLDEAHRAIPAVLSVALVAAAGIAAVIATRARFDPFRPERLWIVIAVSICASIAEFASTAGNNARVYDDFGPYVTGILLIVLAPFVGWLSIVIAGVGAAALQLVVVIGALGYQQTQAPTGVSLIAATAPLLALTAVAAGFSAAIVRNVLARQRAHNRAMIAAARARGGRGPNDRARLLVGEVLPFFVEIASATRVSVEQVDRARELAEALEEVPETVADRDWLAELAGRVVSAGRRMHVDDVGAASTELTTGQANGVAALVRWLAGARTPELTAIEVHFGRAGGRPEVVVDATLESDAPDFRRELDGFAVVLGSLFAHVEVTRARDNTRVTMSDVVATYPPLDDGSP